jgi:molecular chaperone GrpE
VSKEEETPQPTELDARDDDAESPGERVYDIDSSDVDPMDGDVPGDDVAGESGADSADGETAERKPGRGPLKFSRSDILNRFQEKNSAITRLTKEKTALEKKLAALAEEKSAFETQLKDAKDRWLRTAAEFENYRKRTAKEWELLKQQSKTEVILEVLSSLDDFERAFAAVGATDESEFVRGIRLIYNNLLQVLQKLGVAEIAALGTPFDPNCHMAIGQIETGEVASGHVAQVAEKGYTLNDSVIRPARVVVAK